MSDKGIKIKAKFEGEEKEYYNIKKDKDNSQYIIPKNTPQKEGKHISVHPSGIINIRSKAKDSYNILKKLPELKEHIEKRINNPIKIENADFALVLDYRKVEKFANVIEKEHILDMDSYIEESEKIAIENNNFDFIDNYQSDFITILVFDISGNAYFAFKNKKGFGIPITPE